MNETDDEAAVEAVMLVGDWETKCSVCGGGVLTEETHHTTRLPGFSGETSREGCGALFVGMRPGVAARIMPGVRPCGAVAASRPDLPVLAS